MFMRSRGFLLSFVSLFAVLVSVQALAQSFAPAVTYASGGNGPNAVTTADLTGAGRLDLVVANWCTDPNCTASSVGVLLSNGDGTFKPAVAYSSGGIYADAVAVADVNNDGKLDIVVGNCGHPKITKCATSHIGVLLGNGDGTFQKVIRVGLNGSGAASVAVADVNGDNIPDLLVATGSASGSWVGVLLGNGDGTFQALVPYATGGLSALSVAVADVNGDTKPDLVVGNWCTDSNCATTSVGVLLGNGDGTFQPVTTYDSGGIYADSVVIEDVNGDSKPDLLVANGSSPTVAAGNVSVLLGNGDGTFQTAVAYSRGGYGATSLAVTDVNGDGKRDLVVANCSTSAINCAHVDGNLAVLLGNGDGTFQTATTYSSGGTTPFGVAVGDLNGDGKPDIVAANCVNNQCGAGPGELGVLLNTSLTSTMTALTSSANPSKFGQAVTFTATVTVKPGFATGTPTGTVSFFNGTISIGTSSLNGGVATLTTSTLPVGTDSITAKYSGDTNFTSSTSPALQQLVQGAIVSLSPASLNFGDQAIGVTSGGKTMTLQNSGNVNLGITSIQITGTNSGDFKNGTTCSSSLSPNTSCQISVTFTPSANGTRNAVLIVTDSATSSPQSATLTGIGSTTPNFTVTANPTSVTVNSGTAANYVITLTPSNGYDGTVTITCPTNLPSGVSCNTPTIAPGKTQTTLTVSTTVASAAMTRRPDLNSHQASSNLLASLGSFGLFGMILAGDWKKRNRRGIFIALTVLAVIMILALVGCGSGSISGGGGGTNPNTYPLQLVATGTAGTNNGSTAPHPIPVTLVVK
jgi:hypothetical protein